MSVEQELHNIDRPEGKYSNLELDEFMVFCILDTSVPYEKCCQAFDMLRANNLTTRYNLKRCMVTDIYIALRDAGYRWANQKAKYLKEFGNNPIDLKTASREEIVKNVKGVGMKLASMFLRNTRGHDYAVIDIHTDRWLQKELGLEDEQYKGITYEHKEMMFRGLAESRGVTTQELDLAIWQSNRIGNRKKK